MNVRLFSNLRFAPLLLGTLFLVQGCINSDRTAPPTAKEQIGDAVADAVSDTEAKQVELALRAVDDMAKIQSLKALSPHLIEMSTSDGVAYVKGVRPAADLCERGVERLGGAMAAAERLGVKSTPVMIFEDGTRRVGASSSQDIEKALQQAAAKRVSKT